MHLTRRTRRAALAIVAAIAITGLAGAAPAGAAALATPDLKASSDSGLLSTDNITNDNSPTFVVADALDGDVVKLLRDGVQVASGTKAVGVTLELTDPGPAAEGDRAYTLQRDPEDPTAPLTVTIDTVAPTTAPSAPDLQAASDTGKSSTDNVTKDNTPTFDHATAVPGDAATTELLRNGASVANGAVPQTLGTPATDATAPVDGTYNYAARFVDTAGNAGAASPNLSVRIDTSGFISLTLSSTSDTGRSNSDGYTTGLNLGVGAAIGLPAGVYAEVLVGVGIDTGSALTWSRTDPNGVVTPGVLFGAPATGGAGFTVATDILSIFVGQTPVNGLWTYTVSTTDDAGNASSGLLKMVIDTTAPALPVIDLQAASDLGSKNDDNVTQSQAAGLKLDVTAEADTLVELFRDGLTVTPPTGPPAFMPCPPAAAPVTCPTPNPAFLSYPTANPGTTLTMAGFNDTNASTLSAWHGYVAQLTDRAGNVSAGNLPVYIDADAPAAPSQLDLIAEDDHGAASDDNITNVALPRFNVTGAEDGSIVQLTACEGPGCSLVLSLAPFIQRATRTTVIGTRVGNGIIQPDPEWWKKTQIGQLDNYTSGGPVLPGNAANTSWRFSVQQRDLSGRLGATFSQDLNVVIDTTPLPAPSSPDLVAASDTGPSDSDNVTSAVSPRFNVAVGQGRVELLRNGQPVAVRTAAGDLVDPGPLQNGTYTYTTRATDTAGNVSGQSAPLAVVVAHSGGYWLVASDGGVFTMGNAPFFGSLGDMRLNAPVIAVIPTPTHNGYWLLAKDGGVFAMGDAGFFGSTGDMTLNSPIVGMVATPSGLGYWLFAADGGVFTFGDAGFFGSPAAAGATSRVVAMRAAPDGLGYWLVTATGKVYGFGSAASLPGVDDGPLNSPIVGMAVTPTGRGLWLVGSDGGVFTLGDAAFAGSMGGERLNSPIIGVEAVPTGDGYWELAGDGGVFAFGNAPFLGSTGGLRLNRPIVGMGVA